MIEGADYFIRLIPFPLYNTGGMVMPNDDGTYSIYLNAKLNEIRRRRAFLHELRHIERGDLESEKPIEDIERI